MKKYLHILLLVAAVIRLSAQTLYVPGGTTGIGNNTTNGNVGIGTTTPTASLQVGTNIGNQGFKIGVSGNMANSNAEIRGTLAVLGTDASSISTLGATAWNYYNAGNAPSWSGTLLMFSGSNMTGNFCGMPAANQGTLLFQNVASGVIASNGASIYVAPQGVVSTTFLAGGNVGIGTVGPGSKLQVSTSAQSVDGISVVGSDGHSISLRASNSTGANNGITQAGDTGLIFSNGSSGTGAFVIAPWANATSGLRMDSSGNVGIGTTNPTQKLAVNGSIRAKEVIVDTGWSDYVFSDDYRLAPLSEVEAHIKAEKHLPGIPSAAEVAAGGVSLGDMQSKLLAKLEELTLHQIAQAKELSRLRDENSSLQSQILELKSAVTRP